MSTKAIPGAAVLKKQGFDTGRLIAVTEAIGLVKP